jgi:hypothetical protein
MRGAYYAKSRYRVTMNRDPASTVVFDTIFSKLPAEPWRSVWSKTLNNLVKYSYAADLW